MVFFGTLAHPTKHFCRYLGFLLGFLIFLLVLKKSLEVKSVISINLPSELELSFLNLVDGENIFDNFSLEHDLLAELHVGQSEKHDDRVDQDPVR